MKPEMLSMRQKEMSYQHLAAAVATSASSARNYNGNSSSIGTSRVAGPLASSSSTSLFDFAGANPASPMVASYYGGSGAKGSHAMAGMPRGSACYSPLSVGQLAPHHTVTANYDQYGFVWLWISEVCVHFALQRQTAHYAVCYAQRILRQRLRAREEDAYLMRAYDDIFTVQKELQVLGLTCVFIAAKIEEVHPPKAADFAEYISENGAVACSTDEVVRYEGQHLLELKWNLHPTTVLSWLLFLLAGDVSDQPIETMADFANSSRVSSVRHDVFTAAINLIDASLLDYQSMEFLPSALAGAAILLADPGLDLVFVAQFLQLDPTLLWECKNWMYVATNALADVGGGQTPRDTDRWAKVPAEEVLFVQAQVPVPSHLAYGLLRNENTAYGYLAASNNHQSDHGMYDHHQGIVYDQQGVYDHHHHQGGGAYDQHQQVMYDPGYDSGGGYASTGYSSSTCMSPATCSTYGCYCGAQDNYQHQNQHHHSNQSSSAVAAPSVYHFKYGWQGSDMAGTGFTAPTVQRKLHFS